jgi:hypothetical protein
MCLVCNQSSWLKIVCTSVIKRLCLIAANIYRFPLFWL